MTGRWLYAGVGTAPPAHTCIRPDVTSEGAIWQCECGAVWLVIWAPGAEEWMLVWRRLSKRQAKRLFKKLGLSCWEDTVV